MTGVNLDASINIVIDGITCSHVNITNSTSLTCVTGPRPNPPTNGHTFVAIMDGSFVAVTT
jgi:hypothetical protein